MVTNKVLDEILRSQGPFDESLHSFLLRIIWNYDPTIKPIGVIKKSGGFVYSPFCHKNIEHLFRSYPDHVLLEIIDINETINGENNSIFDCPANYTYRIKDTFFPNKNKNEKRLIYKDIKYCLACINESIKSFGYGYFRSFWEIDNKCLIHHSPLKKIPIINITKTIKSIKMIMKGIEPKGAIEVKIQKKEYKTPVNPDDCLNEKYLFPIKFADCLMHPFAIWIIKNKDKFKSNNLKTLAFKAIAEYIDCDNRSNITNDMLIKKRFTYFHLLCSSEEPNMLSDFYLNHVDFLELYLGPREEGVIKEIYSKSKEHKCSTCNLQHCTIKNGTTHKPLSRKKINSDFLFNSSYTLNRIAMQGRAIKILGSEPWTPIDVCIESKI